MGICSRRPGLMNPARGLRLQRLSAGGWPCPPGAAPYGPPRNRLPRNIIAHLRNASFFNSLSQHVHLSCREAPDLEDEAISQPLHPSNYLTVGVWRQSVVGDLALGVWPPYWGRDGDDEMPVLHIWQVRWPNVSHALAQSATTPPPPPAPKFTYLMGLYCNTKGYMTSQ